MKIVLDSQLGHLKLLRVIMTGVKYSRLESILMTLQPLSILDNGLDVEKLKFWEK
jgi:hypothetical protein